jgi:hypothetical protein
MQHRSALAEGSGKATENNLLLQIVRIHCKLAVIAEGGGHSPKYMSYPPGADVLMDVSGGSDCTSVFRIAKIHSLR